MPRVLSASSTPSHFERSQRPATSAAWAWGTLRAWASSIAIVCSAADRMFDCGALTTITPRAGGRLDVDVVEADAGPADDHQVGAGLEHLGGDRGGRPDDEGVGARHRRRAAPRGTARCCTSTSWPAGAGGRGRPRRSSRSRGLGPWGHPDLLPGRARQSIGVPPTQRSLQPQPSDRGSTAPVAPARGRRPGRSRRPGRRTTARPRGPGRCSAAWRKPCCSPSKAT